MTTKKTKSNPNQKSTTKPKTKIKDKIRTQIETKTKIQTRTFFDLTYRLAKANGLFRQLCEVFISNVLRGLERIVRFAAIDNVGQSQDCLSSRTTLRWTLMNLRSVTRILLALLMTVSSAMAQSSNSQSIDPTDNSDWWSELNPIHDDLPAVNVQKHAIAAGSLRILGLTVLARDNDHWLFPKFGEAPAVFRGDASTARVQVCYRSSNSDGTYLISESGEVELGFYLFTDTRKWKGQELCHRSPLVSMELATDSGLHLGLTRSHVRKILGKPSLETMNTQVYSTVVEISTSPDGIKNFLQRNPSYRETEIATEFSKSYTLTVFITAKFTGGRLTYLHVDKSEVD